MEHKSNKITFLSKADHPRMHAFSYVWSLPVTWRGCWSQYSVCNSWKPHAKCKLHGSVLQNWSHCRSKFYTAGIGIVYLSASVSWPWPSYTTLTCILSSYTGCANVNFPCQGFRKSSDIHTYTQTDTTEIIYNAALWVVRNVTVKCLLE